MKKYWLFKSESDVFSIDDLKNMPSSTSTWEGIRNYQARNFLRDSVQLKDEVFFYHSRIEPIGIVGIMEITKNGYPDTFAFNANSEYYDKKSNLSQPTWYMVDVVFKKKFEPMIPLQELRTYKELSKMILLQKGSRLSIQPVTDFEFNFILGLRNK
jgi:predicted RNA-binding protein with PUA-like domain